MNVVLDAQRGRIRAALLATPTASNRAIGTRVGSHHVTVGTVRKLLEAAGEITTVDKTVGADGKAYFRRPIKVHEPSVLDRQVTEANASLVQEAQTNGRCGELIAALRRLLKGLVVEQRRDVPLAEPVGEVVDVADVPEVPAKKAAVHNVRDVALDIQPADDADLQRSQRVTSDAATLEPTDERVAHEDEAALNRKPAAVEASEPAPEPEGWWELGRVVHLHFATQCGRVRLDDGAELNFTDKTLREPGLVLRVGVEVDCRVIEVADSGRRYVRAVELAKPLEA